MEPLKEWIQPVLEKMGCELYSIEWDTGMKPPVLRISIENTKGPTDLDTCAAASDAISSLLDEKDYSDQEYMLEVCSPGAERPIETEEEMNRAIGRYVHVKLKEPRQGLDQVTGDLEDVSDEAVTIRYNAKGRFKTIEIRKDNIAHMNTAVKL